MAGRFVLTGEGGISLTADAVSRLLGAASGDAALLYIYILSRGGHFDPVDAAASIHRSDAQVDAAMGVLTRLGLVTGEARPTGPIERAQEPPTVSAEEMDRLIDTDRGFRELVGAVQNDLGTQLSSEGLRTLINIYSYLRLPADVIMALVTYCRGEYRRRYGEGRVPSMRYIEKEAYVWEREGIFSWEAAEAYVTRMSELKAAERELLPILGISGRALSSTERKYLSAWTGMGFHSDALALAYDRTVVNTGRLTWRYMDSILRSWHSRGLHTPDEIVSGDAPPKFASSPRPRKRPAAGGADQVTSQELENMRAAIRRMKGEH